jgi:hypothetical protein
MYLKNIEKFNFKNYELDIKKFNFYIKELEKLIDFSIEKNIQLCLLGHFSLILLFKKIYRTPQDLDIVINFHEFEKWKSFLSKDWLIYADINYIEGFKQFLKDKFKKFASVDPNTCSSDEESADLFKINPNDCCLYKQCSDNKNLFKEHFIIKGHYDDSEQFLAEEPLWIYHNPQKFNHVNEPFVKIKGNKFKIIFNTNSLGRYYNCFINLYDNYLNKKDIFECYFSYDHMVNDQKISYWESPWLDHETYNDFYYRIYIQKSMMPLRFMHKDNNDFILDIYVDGLYRNEGDINIVFNSIEQFITKRKIKHLNKDILIRDPFETFLNKYGREKDIDDMEFFKDCLERFKLTL